LYSENLRNHFESFYGIKGNKLKLEKGPVENLNPDFHVLEFAPNHRHDFWSYCSNGMSIDRNGDNLVEVFVYSPKQDESIVELITVCAWYHKNERPLNLHHTFNIGRPWLGDSKCDHCYISLPYLDGEEIELFSFNNKIYHCYWLIPITIEERNYKIEFGYESLEQLFEVKGLDYLNPDRE